MSLLLAPFIGGQVSGSWSGSIQTHYLWRFYIVISLFKYSILRLLSWDIIFVGLNPNIDQRYQCHGPWQAYPFQCPLDSWCSTRPWFTVIVDRVGWWSGWGGCVHGGVHDRDWWSLWGVGESEGTTWCLGGIEECSGAIHGHWLASSNREGEWHLCTPSLVSNQEGGGEWSGRV
jgi:hypothetical protein